MQSFVIYRTTVEKGLILPSNIKPIDELTNDERIELQRTYEELFSLDRASLNERKEPS